MADVHEVEAHSTSLEAHEQHAGSSRGLEPPQCGSAFFSSHAAVESHEAFVRTLERYLQNVEQRRPLAKHNALSACLLGSVGNFGFARVLLEAGRGLPRPNPLQVPQQRVHLGRRVPRFPQVDRKAAGPRQRSQLAAPERLAADRAWLRSQSGRAILQAVRASAGRQLAASRLLRKHLRGAVAAEDVCAWRDHLDVIK